MKNSFSETIHLFFELADLKKKELEWMTGYHITVRGMVPIRPRTNMVSGLSVSVRDALRLYYYYT